jgi:hypothetical protein
LEAEEEIILFGGVFRKRRPDSCRGTIKIIE